MRVRLGTVIFCGAIGLGRAIWLAAQLSGPDVATVGFLLLADVPVLGVLLLLALAESRLRRPWSVASIVLSTALVAVYLLDVFTVWALNARLQWTDLLRFAGELWVAKSFLGLTTGIAVLAAAASFLISFSVSRRTAWLLLTAAMLAVVVPPSISADVIPTHVQKYAASVLWLPIDAWRGRRPPASQYTAGDIAAYRAGYEALFDAPFARTRKSVILVIVESLSAVDSARTSGIRDRLPRFDELSARGTLFRNFFANYEASEGGLVAILSGVPPLHYPTASTQPFEEYAVQRTMVDAFRRHGYDTEFLTSVPLRFLSMKTYLAGPHSGFASAAGQQEIARFRGAPRYSFESPADHLLFEEVLARFDAHIAASRDPVFMTVVTATSHPPFIDPRGVENGEGSVWAYVQEEMWWLYDELSRRRFFDDGVLIITGDHRKMRPVRQEEHDRYGESAKARVPLLVIGAGVRSGAVDDRLLQQADVLRLLDRVARPDQPLSPFVVWVNRYIAGLGFAGNAANVEIFTGADLRVPFRLRLHGAEIEWLQRPPDALLVERAIHQQRALQQAVRVSTVPAVPLQYGRDLTPAENTPGVLVGISKDLDIGRDPDDPRDGLHTVTTTSFEQAHVLPLVGGEAPYTLTARGFLRVPADGEYWFATYGDTELCLAIDKRIVVGCQRGLNPGLALLTAGLHRVDFRFVARNSRQRFELKWLRPGERAYEPFPQQTLIAPRPRD
jgi:sulfatase-like protein